MSDIVLRPYQVQFIDDIRAEFRKNHKRVVGVAPCGAGKTIMTGWMIRESARRGKRSIFFVHRHELISQTSETFARLGIEHGIIAAGAPMQPELPVQIASVQTLARRLDKIPAPDFLICDECHHILANTYKKIIDKWQDAFLLGVTATPLRMGGKTLNDVFTSMVLAPSVNELIKLGNLTKFDYFAPDADIDLSKVKTVHGDFANNALEKVMIDKSIVGSIVDNYRLYADGKSAICYCVNVNHSKTVAESFNASGISAAHVDGDTPRIEREYRVEEFRQGKIKVLCNAELFSEGFDVPNCQAVILARPTLSLTLYIQQSMRPLRPDKDDPNKVAVIIDHVKNYLRHGKPNDFHNWSLDPNVPKLKECPYCGELITPTTFTMKKETPFSFKLKNHCFFLKDSYDKDGEPVKLCVDYVEGTGEPMRVVVNPYGRLMKICPECGYLFPTQAPLDTAPAQPHHRDGELEQVHISFDTSTNIGRRIIHKPTTIEEFIVIAKNKGYKLGWAAFQALNFAKSYEDCLHIAQICNYKLGWAFHKWQVVKKELADAQVLQKKYDLDAVDVS